MSARARKRRGGRRSAVTKHFIRKF